MIARRKVAFRKLCSLLRQIEANRDDLDGVKALNIALLREVIRDEAHVRRHRGRIKELKRSLGGDRPTKAQAAVLRLDIKRSGQAIKRYLDQIYIWKCIGDGLAYAYLNTFNIKHAFFETTSTTAKPEAGFLSGKDGLVNEVALLFAALKRGVPAVLSDLTNVVRYGDVCLLGGNDPVCLESKSSSRLNQRGKRQAERLKALDTFLATDRVEGFRGLPVVNRTAYAVPFRDCVDDINVCIAHARRDGFNVVCPERGLVYVAMFGRQPVEEVFAHLDLRMPVFFQLNLEKSEHNWAPYLPFVNTLRDVENLLDFVVGDLSLWVVIDAAFVCDQLAQSGWKVSWLDSPDHSILMEAEDGTVLVISHQFVGRLGLEFMSLDWFVRHEYNMIGRFHEVATRDGGQLNAGALSDMTSWLRAIPRLYETAGRTGGSIAN